MSDHAKSESSSLTRTDPETHQRYFDHHRLDAFHVALEALVQGDAIARSLPRGYGTLADQLRRALQGAYLQTTEAAARSGSDRQSRFRCARAEAGEAAGALQAISRLGLAEPAKIDPVIALLWRLCAMLNRLGKLKR